MLLPVLSYGDKFSIRQPLRLTCPTMQQIGDDARGWAWTRALQGLPANEIHLCGDGSALPLVRTLAKQMGETLQVEAASFCTPSNQEDHMRDPYLHVRRVCARAWASYILDNITSRRRVPGCMKTTPVPACIASRCRSDAGLCLQHVGLVTHAGAQLRAVHAAVN